MGVAGHHLDLDLQVCRALNKLGHEVVVYAHRNCSIEAVNTLTSVCRVVPHFNSGPYVDPVKFDRIAGELFSYSAMSRSIATELNGVSQADLWLWPSIFAYQLKGSAMAQGQVPVAGCVHTPAVSDQYPSGNIFWRDAYITIKNKGKSLNIGGLEPEHKYEYAPLFDASEFKIFSSYIDFVKNEKDSNCLETVGFLGAQRGEKGANLLSQIIPSIIDNGLKVVLQDSTGLLRAKPSPAVSVFGFEPDLMQRIAECDVVILPYDAQKYARKGSGIMMMAMAASVPVVVPFGSSMSRWVERYQNGVCFYEQSPEGILEAIMTARDNYVGIKEAARRVGLQWQSQHGASRFTRDLIEFN
jgi:glycosyltransferase involved in cell wall biosynthesis